MNVFKPDASFADLTRTIDEGFDRLCRGEANNELVIGGKRYISEEKYIWCCGMLKEAMQYAHEQFQDTKAQLAEAVRLLKETEFHGIIDYGASGCRHCDAVGCGAPCDSHADDCQLATFLKEVEQ